MRQPVLMKLRFLWMELKLRYLLRIMQCTLDKFFYLQGQILSYYAMYIGQVILSSRSDSLLLCNVYWTSYSIFKVRFSLMQCMLDKFYLQGQILSYYAMYIGQVILFSRSDSLLLWWKRYQGLVRLSILRKLHFWVYCNYCA